MPHAYMVDIWLFSLSVELLPLADTMEQPHGNIHYEPLRNETNSFDLISLIMIIPL